MDNLIMLKFLWVMSEFWDPGYPDLPTCGPQRGSVGVQVQPIFSTNNTRPSRGAKPREADDAKTFGGGRLLRLAPVERRFLCKPSPHEVRMTQPMATKARQAQAGAVQQVSPSVLK